MSASLSLEPLLSLLGTLARDLQTEYLSNFPQVVKGLSTLLDEGCNRVPELLEVMFTSLCWIFKYVSRHLSTNLPMALQHTAVLRYNRDANVQKFMGDSMAFLFRTAKRQHMEVGVRCLMVENAMASNDSLAAPASTMLSQVMMGIQHGLHSKAPIVLGILLLSEKPSAEEFERSHETLAQVAEWQGNGQEAGVNGARSTMLDESYWIRCTASLSRHVIERLCIHVRREKSIPLWQTLLGSVATCLDAPALGEHGGMHVQKLAEMVGLVAQVVEHRGGSRVIDYQDLFLLARKLIGKICVNEGGVLAQESEFLVENTHRLLLAIINGHRKVVGASQGPLAVAREAQLHWGHAFTHPKPELLVPFLRRLANLDLPLRCWRLLQGHIVESSMKCIAVDSLHEEVSVVLLSFCNKLQVERLERFDCSLSNEYGSLFKDTLSALLLSNKNPERIWFAVQIVPLVHSNPRSVVEQVLAREDLTKLAASGNGEALAVLSQARMTKGSLLRSQGGNKDELVSLVESSMQSYELHPSSFSCAHAVVFLLGKTAEMFEIDPHYLWKDISLRHLLHTQKLRQLLDCLAVFQSSFVKEERCIATKLAAYFEPCAWSGEEVEDEVVNVFAAWDTIENGQITLATSRRSVLLIDKILHSIEANLLNADFCLPTAMFMCAAFRIQYSALWRPATKVLALTLKKQPKKVWPFFYSTMIAEQNAFFVGQRNKPSMLPVAKCCNDGALFQEFQDFQHPPERDPGTDSGTVLQQLLIALTSVPEVWSMYGNELLDMFLSYCRVEVEGQCMPKNQVSGKAWRTGLLCWLDLLALYKTPKRLKSSVELYAKLEDLLTNADPSTQSKALKCLQMYRLHFLDPYVDHLYGLCNQKTIRDVLIRFPLWPNATILEETGTGSRSTVGGRSDSPAALAILPEHRAELIPLIIRILHPRLKKGKGGSIGRSNAGTLRTNILNALGGLASAELGTLFLLLLRPFIPSSQLSLFIDGYDKVKGINSTPVVPEVVGGHFLEQIDVEHLRKVPLKTQAAFLDLMCDFVLHMPSSISLYLGCICSIAVMLGAASIVDECPGVKAHGEQDIRRVALKFWIQIFSEYDSVSFSAFWPLLLDQINPIARKMQVECLTLNRPPAILELLNVVCSSKLHSNIFLQYPSSREWILSTIELLGVTGIHNATYELVCRSLQALYDNLGASNFCDALSDHLNTLLLCLQARLKDSAADNSGKGRLQHVSSHELGMLQVLAGCVQSQDQYCNLIYSFAEFLKKKSKHESTKVSALKTLAALLDGLHHLSGHLSDEVLVKTVQVLSILAGRVSDTSFQSILSQVFSSLGKVSILLRNTAELCVGLNAVAADKLGERDYETRLACYSEMSESFWTALPQPSIQAVPLLHVCFRDVRDSDDMALRHGSAACLMRLLKAARYQSSNSTPSANSQSMLLSLLPRVVYPSIKSGLTSSSLSVRQEHVSLLRALGTSFPEAFPALHLLTNEEQEADILQNIIHLQPHRVSRALARLKRLLENTPAVSSIYLDVLLPILLPYVLDAKDRGGLSESAVMALEAGVAFLTWPQFRQLLNQLTGLLNEKHQETEEDQIMAHLNIEKKRSNAAHRALVRAICAVLGKYGDLNLGLNSKSDELQNTQALGEPAYSRCSPHIQEEMHKYLSTRVLPVLKAMLLQDSEVLNPHVALANVKVLQYLPKEIEQQELPNILQSVCNVLKSRNQDVRNKTRRVLASIILELGPSYLPYLIEVMGASLSKGYQVHVLGYTLHSLLECFVMSKKNGKDKPCWHESHSVQGPFDEILPTLLPLLEADIFGQVSEEREVDKIAASMKEAKTCMSYNTFLILAQGITFRQKFWHLLQPVRSRLEHAQHYATAKKLESILASVSQGLFLNPTASAEDILVLVHTLIEDGVAAQTEEQQAQEDNRKNIGLVQASTSRSVSGLEAKRKEPNQHFLVAFALRVLSYGLKHNILNKNTEGMLEPLVGLLVQSARSKHSNVSELSIRCLCHLIPLKLSSVEEHATEMANGVYIMLRRAGKSSSSLAQSCLKELCALFNCSNYKPPAYELVFLLKYAFTDLEDSATMSTSFSLIKSIVKRKFVCMEVYDLMERIEKLLVCSHSPQVRTLCSQVLLVFFLDYPLGEKRLQRHLRSIFANFEYEYEEGRLAAYDMVSAIISKFPTELLDAQFELFFFPLVSKLVSDSSNSCRLRVGTALQTLFQETSDQSHNSAVEFCLKWLEEGNPMLQRTACQVIGMMVEAGLGTKLQKQLRQTLPRHISLLTDGCKADVIPNQTSWQISYFALSTVEKMLKQGTAKLDDPEIAELEMLITSDDLLLHKHLWVRKVSSRLLLLILENGTLSGGYSSIDAEDKLDSCGKLAWALIAQLEGEDLDEEFVESIVQNLMIVGSHIQNIWSFLGSHTCQSACGASSDAGEKIWKPTVDWIARKVSGKIASSADRSTPARVGALKFLAEFPSKLSKETTVTDILPSISRALVVIFSSAASSLPEQVQKAAEELQNQMRNLVGAEAVALSYARMKEAVSQKREKRKKAEALRAIVDPEAHARTKLRQSRKRKESKKRKIEEFQRYRGGQSKKRVLG
eukprot:scaffold358_cov343-Pavlova_lutheri.AAC.37